MPEAQPVKTKTIKELGATLPIGVLSENKKLAKSFSLRPYKSKIDRHLNHWRAAHEGAPVAALTTKLLSLIVSEIGGKALPVLPDGDTSPDQEYDVSQWYYGDVMYIWIYLRIVAISHEMEVPFVCRSCGETGFANADLWTTEVRIVDNPGDLVRWVELTTGVKLHTGRVAKKVKLQPTTFKSQMMPESESKSAGLGYAGLRESICAVDCEQGHYVLRDEEIDEIDKVDMLRIEKATQKVVAGPDMRTTIKCPKERCGTLIRNAFDWTYDNFFESSVPLYLLE